MLIDFARRHKGGFVTEIEVNGRALRECVLRVHQRQYYFEVFHNMDNGVSEIKRIALYCFWLLKYRPFVLKFKPDLDNFPAKVERRDYFEERFCIFLLTMQIRRSYSGTPRLPISDNGVADIVYSLKHHDVSKETLTLLFETLEDVVRMGAKTTPYSVE